MKVDGKPMRTIWLDADGSTVGIIDQTALPHRFATLRLTTLADAVRAIASMQVRGAPLIFFFTDSATTDIYTLSLHDALPISRWPGGCASPSGRSDPRRACRPSPPRLRDRKSTRLNSSHGSISYAVFCLKK